MRELTLTVLVLDDETCWIREEGTMRQITGMTGDDLGVGDGGAVAVIAPKRKYTRRAKSAKTSARVKKSRGGASPVPPAVKRGGRDGDQDANAAELKRRVLAGESLPALAKEFGVNYQTLYGRAKKWKAGEDVKPRSDRGLTIEARPRKSRGVPDADTPVSNGRRYCNNCGQTSPADKEKCLHCFEKFAA